MGVVAKDRLQEPAAAIGSMAYDDRGEEESELCPEVRDHPEGRK